MLGPKLDRDGSCSVHMCNQFGHVVCDQLADWLEQLRALIDAEAAAPKPDSVARIKALADREF